jgi:hypothetical protein
MRPLGAINLTRMGAKQYRITLLFQSSELDTSTKRKEKQMYAVQALRAFGPINSDYKRFGLPYNILIMSSSL